MDRQVGRVIVLAVCLVLEVAVNPAVPEAADGAPETRPLYSSAESSARAGWSTSAPTPTAEKVAPWSIHIEERTGGPGGAPFLWVNGDWKALPWAGLDFRHKAGETWRLTKEWLESGFIRFLLKAGVDRYGSPAGRIVLQMAPVCDKHLADLVGLQPRFVNQGRGFDGNSDAWQEVLIPLRAWGLTPGTVMRGFMIQCVDRPSRSFGVAEVAFIRFEKEKLPVWFIEAENAKLAQPWVTWPDYAQLPEALKADRHPPEVRDGRFVTPDGRRIFVLNGWSFEDQRGDLWGRTDGKRPPDYGLFDPQRHGWIYNELPTRESLCRLGFNSFSFNILAPRSYPDFGDGAADWNGDPKLLPETVRRIGLPFYVDALTAGAYSPPKSKFPAEVFTKGEHHWTPYSTIGAGHDVWLKMWRQTARHFKDAGARVLMFELMNEPAQVDVSAAHRQEFAGWLRKRYASPEEMNAAWKTCFTSWDEAVAFDSEKELRQTPGRLLDYDDYLSARFADLVGDGVAAVNAVLPGTLVGLQPMSGFALQPRETIWPHRIIPRETVVIAPTGGGDWSAGARASRPGGSLIEYPMAGAPLENDLLLALAGNKMVFDNETYLGDAQTARAVRNRLWSHVIAGLDGLTIFSMTKWGYDWWDGRPNLRAKVDHTYSNLNPLHRRTEALRGIHDFAAEVQTLADKILAKPWGPSARIGLLYSWPQARRWWIEPNRVDKTPYYHAALRYTHWNAALVPSDRALAPDGLTGYDVLITGGIRVVEPQMPARLEAFVRQGGVLVMGEEPMAEDLYGRPLDTAQRLGVRWGAWLGAKDTELAVPDTPVARAIDGTIRRIPNLREIEVTGGSALISTADGAPAVVRRKLGRGFVYAVAADLACYPLAKVLSAVLEDAARARGGAQTPDAWRTVEARTPEGSLSPNVLVSRRSYADHHAILLLNQDAYRKTVRLKVPGLTGTWCATEGLANAQLTPEDGWYRLTLDPGAPAVLMLEKATARGGGGKTGTASCKRWDAATYHPLSEDAGPVRTGP